MEKTDAGTSVGVTDPYAQVDRCDHLTDEGRCRFAVEQGDRDPHFAAERRREDYRCPVVAPPDEDAPVTLTNGDGGGGGDGEKFDGTSDGAIDDALDGEWDWGDCPHFRCRNHDRECARCGLAEVRMAHADDRPLLEEHHLSYAGDSAEGAGEPSHEITVFLCRWCHAKVHKSWAAVEDDVNPDPEAIAAREERRSKEQAELGFESANDRLDE